MTSRRQHRRLDDVEAKADTRNTAPLLSIVDPEQDPNPPHRFNSEEAANQWFEERDQDPILVVYEPVPERKQK
jgi:hypothetical protein